MTYYEELGLSARATHVEIKQSYKRLTLLLHPDQHQDPALRALAETQMKRLNEMVGILADAQQRLQYDQTLLELAINVRHPPRRKCLFWLRNNRGWLLVGAVSLLFLCAALLIPHLDSTPPVALVVTPALQKLAAAPAGSTGGRPAPDGRATTGSILSHRPWKAGGRPPPKPEGPQALEGLTESATPMAPRLSVPAFLSPAPSLAPVATAGIAGAEPSTLIGKWVYTPDPNDLHASKVFPAEYIELTIAAVDGQVHGTFRSRYRLSDRALNPYANFTFDGSPAGTSFDWRGDGGSKGQVTLRLQSLDKLEVTWFATNMGSGLSLGSGLAIVYRFR